MEDPVPDGGALYPQGKFSHAGAASVSTFPLLHIVGAKGRQVLLTI